MSILRNKFRQVEANLRRFPLVELNAHNLHEQPIATEVTPLTFRV